MSSFYSGWVSSDDWRLRLDVSVSTSETGYTYNTALFVQSNYATMRNTACAWSITIDGKTYSGSNSAPGVVPGHTVRVASASRTVSRGTSARNIGISFSAKFPSSSIASYRSGTSGSGSESLPALRSFTISYNANGGSGAPGNQTKWYGVNLTISSTRPTRTGHDFDGWATSASGSVAYQPGATYTDNSALTLYAKWTPYTYTVSYNANGGTGAPGNQTKTYGQTLKLSSTIPSRTNYNFKGWGTSASSTSVAYAAGANYTNNSAITLYAIWELAWLEPRITDLQATRCDSAGTLKEDGTYAMVTFNWATDRTISSIEIVCNGVTTNVSGSDTSGSVSVVVGANALDIEKSYPVNVTVTDAVGGVTFSTTVAPMNFIMDISPNGSVAFGMPAPSGSSVLATAENTTMRLAGIITAYASEYTTGVTNAWRYKTLAKSSLPVTSLRAGGAVRIFGTIGMYNDTGAIDVTIPLRDTTNTSITVTELSQTAFDPDVADGSCAAIIVIKDAANYLHFVYAAVGYNRLSINLFCLAGIETFSLDSQDWATSRVDGDVIFETSAIWKTQFGGYPAKLEYQNGYYGFALPDKTRSEWIRTTIKGLIPYQADGVSSLGTESWPFDSAYINNVHVHSNNLYWDNTGGLKGRVMKQIWSGSLSINGSTTVSELPYYNIFVCCFDRTYTEYGLGIRSPGSNVLRFFSVNFINNGIQYASTLTMSVSGTTLKMTGNMMTNGINSTSVLNGVGFYRLWGVL